MTKIITISLFIFLLMASCIRENPSGCFPQDKLPDNVETLTSFGQRAEWSPDGKKIFFVDSAGGDVWQVDVRTKKTSTSLELDEAGQTFIYMCSE